MVPPGFELMRGVNAPHGLRRDRGHMPCAANGWASSRPSHGEIERSSCSGSRGAENRWRPSPYAHPAVQVACRRSNTVNPRRGAAVTRVSVTVRAASTRGDSGESATSTKPWFAPRRMKSVPPERDLPPIPFDQQGLVALFFLSLDCGQLRYFPVADRNSHHRQRFRYCHERRAELHANWDSCQLPTESQ